MKTTVLIISSFLIAFTCTAQKTDSAVFYFQKGLEEKKAGHWLPASKHFDKAISFNPKFTDAYLENGKVNQEMRRINEANLNFSKAYEIDPASQAAIKELSTLYYNNRQFEKAIELASKCKACPESTG